MYSLVTIPKDMFGNSVIMYALAKDGAIVAMGSNYTTIVALQTAANS